MAKLVIKSEAVARLVYLVRGERVMPDADLAGLYGVETGSLNRAVKRNPGRFPEDFMFQLTEAEWENLKSQSGISSAGHGGRRASPNAFTEQVAAMLSSVLHSPCAVEANLAIMRTFVPLRRQQTALPPLPSVADIALAECCNKSDNRC